MGYCRGKLYPLLQKKLPRQMAGQFPDYSGYIIFYSFTTLKFTRLPEADMMNTSYNPLLHDEAST